MTERMTGAAFAALMESEKKPAGTRYGNKRVEDPDGGRAFDSRAELRYAGQLKLEQRAGLVVSWERQVRLAIEPEGVRLCVYVADFVVRLPGDRFRVVECKGVWTDYAILKAKAFRLYWLPKHPTYEYVVVGGVRRQPNGRGKR